MKRIMTIAFAVFVGAIACPSLAQEQKVGTLPPGPPPGPTDGSWLIEALFVQANMFEGGNVMILRPTVEAQDPNAPPEPPSVFLKVDGKTVRAFGTDRKPLTIDQLETRLSLRAAAIVVHSNVPDEFFLKVLSERTVVIVVTKKQFRHLAKGSGQWITGYWNEMKGDAPSGEVWDISENEIALKRLGKLEGSFAYRLDDSDYPKTIDLTPDHGPAKGMVLKGIYELDGLTMKICYVSPILANPASTPRPQEFGANKTITVVLRCVSP